MCGSSTTFWTSLSFRKLGKYNCHSFITNLTKTNNQCKLIH